MKIDFKVGDRVRVLSREGFEELEGMVGTLVSIDSDGDYLIKFDEDVDTFSYCMYNNYKSDKNDLINIQEKLGHKIELI